MTLNLLTSPWLEVKRQNGEKEFVSISELTSNFDTNPIIALDFPLPDWNAAVTEFIIGVFFLIWAPKSTSEWAAKIKSPPTREAVAEALSEYAQYFDFDGENIRAFQDFDSLDSGKNKPIPLEQLFLNSASTNALDKNSDLFVKRIGNLELRLEYAAASLITLQTFAPEGGRGHLTSLRGGGPLTTLLIPIRKKSHSSTFWDIIWANVPNYIGGDELIIERSFPWLAPIVRGIISQENSPNELAFFACPRRIRIVFKENSICNFSGINCKTAVSFFTEANGANYASNMWRHPLTPYYISKDGDSLPIKPKNGSWFYRDWAAWWSLNDGKPSIPTNQWQARLPYVREFIEKKCLISATGYRFKSADPLQWLNSTIPLIPLSDSDDLVVYLKGEVNLLIEAAKCSADSLTKYSKLAVYGQKAKPKDGKGITKIHDLFTLPKNAKLDTFAEIGDSLWQETENDFRNVLIELQNLIESAANTMELRDNWRRTLANRALRIFEQFVDIDGLMDENPHRILWAHKQLQEEFFFGRNSSVTKALKLEKFKKDVE